MMEATMRITSASLLCAAALFTAPAVFPAQLFAQTAKPAATAHSSAAHSAATTRAGSAHTATAAASAHTAPGGCVKPEVSAKVPALPAGAPCPKALFTVMVEPPAKVIYASPLEPDIAKTLNLESTSFTLAYVDTKAGTGALAAPHKYYTVKYTGYLPDGTVFDSSSKHPETADGFSFEVGTHHVIPGWDTGFAGMHVGGKRRLFIPYPLAYGAQGQPPTIPPRSDLIFDMELVSQSDSAPAPKTTPAPPAAATPRPATPATAAPAGAVPPTVRMLPPTGEPATAPATSTAPTTQPAAAAPGTQPSEKK
jgi:peptidylprolyl isomerase